MYEVEGKDCTYRYIWRVDTEILYNFIVVTFRESFDGSILCRQLNEWLKKQQQNI